MRIQRAILFIVAMLGLAATPHRGAAAEDYPTRPIKLIVPYGPGGAGDLSGRLIAQQLTASMGQNVVVINVPGAGNVAGVVKAIDSPNDGYTLLLLSNAGGTSPLLYSKPPYQISALAPIALICTQPYVFAVNPSLPAKTLKDFIAYAKANPGKLNYGSNGVGAGNHLIAAKFLKDEGLDLVSINYSGTGPGEQSLMSGEIQFYVEDPANAVSLDRGGRIRILATTGRLASAPNIPTTAELGYPLPGVLAWYGIAAPAGTPKPIVDKLSREIAKAVASPKFVKAMTDADYVAKSSSPAGFQKVIDDTNAYYGPIIKSLNIQLDSP